MIKLERNFPKTDSLVQLKGVVKVMSSTAMAARVSPPLMASIMIWKNNNNNNKK